MKVLSNAHAKENYEVRRLLEEEAGFSIVKTVAAAAVAKSDDGDAVSSSDAAAAAATVATVNVTLTSNAVREAFEKKADEEKKEKVNENRKMRLFLPMTFY